MAEHFFNLIMTQKVTIQVEKQPGEKNFTCYMVESLPDFGLTGYGKTAREAINDLYEGQKETREALAEMGKTMPELEFTFKFDVGSFFSYDDCLNIAGVARRAGINASLMRQYAADVHRPSPKRMAQIEQAVHDMAEELHAVALGQFG